MDSQNRQIEAFISTLSTIPDTPNAENLYRAGHEHSAVRLSNLRTYLAEMAALSPTRIFVGEAPGYKGCKLTGVPFTSEKILIEGLPGLPLFGTGKGYRMLGASAPCSEQSATIVWGVLSTMIELPLLWNAFPFHPYQPGNPSSNRKPTLAELQIGSGVLRQLLDIFAVQEVIAVGNSAYGSLSEMGIPSIKVRHPANGGKSRFTIEALAAVS